MTTKQKSNSLCTTSVPPIAWNDKAILGVCYNGKLSKSLRININFKIKSGCPKGNHSLTPVVVCKMNTREPLVIIGFNDFFELIKS